MTGKFFRALHKYHLDGDRYDIKGASVCLSEWGGMVSLDLVEAVERGSGRAAVEKLKRVADRTGTMILGYIDAAPTRTGHIRSNAKLAKWWTAQGFRVNVDGKHQSIRYLAGGQ